MRPPLLPLLVQEQLTDASSRLVITQCCMQALYNMGEEAQDVVDVAKGFERRMCNHLKARSEDECLTAMAGAPSSLSTLCPDDAS